MTPNPETQNLISIIIPAYNSGKFIETTLNNLFAQTYQNFEIIVAYDEKSTDNSLELLQKINETHPITIDIGKDTSSGTARNRGFRLAKGEYVIFVDADDEILPDYLNSLKSVYDIHPELDVVCCDRLIVSEEECKRARKSLSKIMGTINIYDKDTAIMLKATHTLSNGPWVYLIRRKYILDNNIYWPDYSIRDDYVFTLRLMEFTDKLGHYAKPLYLFIQHKVSTTHINFAKLSDKSAPSRQDLNDIYNRLNKNALYEWMLRENRLIASGAACSYSYKEFLLVLIENRITKLSIYKDNDTLIGAISAIIFNISKYVYYKGVRYTKKIR